MGIFLTTTKNAGTGNVIPLADANYFINGYGINKRRPNSVTGTKTNSTNY